MVAISARRPLHAEDAGGARVCVHSAARPEGSRRCVTFNAPTKPGKYPLICSCSGHPPACTVN